MRYDKDGKFHIKKEDLNRGVILIKNHQSQQELMNVQGGALSAYKNLLPLPEESFEKYNAFRKKHKMKPLTEAECMIIDVSKMKQERAQEDFNKAKEIFKG